MAELFLARQPQPEGRDKTLVIKRIRPHLSSQPAFVRMFLNEARLAALLNHPNIVQIHDLGCIGDTYYIAMEHLSGRDMRRIVPKAESMGIAFPLAYALHIAACVCEGLHYAHQKADLYGTPLNIVHRDVTPENIFVCFDGTVKVLDFGIAKAANQVEQTRAGQLKGKAGYLSPEQCLGRPLDCRSDLFSLGVVLYEWVTGVRLFGGDNDIQTMRNIVEGKIYAPSYFRVDLPQAVERIVLKALERDREKRYQSAREFKQDLEKFLQEYEFSPTPLHLANFLKQIFADESEEPKRRSAGGTPSSGPVATVPAAGPIFIPPPPVDTEPSEVLSPEVVGGEGAKAGAEGERTLQVPLTAAQHEALEGLARKHGLPAGRLVAEILESWLKYR